MDVSYLLTFHHLSLWFSFFFMFIVYVPHAFNSLEHQKNSEKLTTQVFGQAIELRFCHDKDTFHGLPGHERKKKKATCRPCASWYV